MMAVFNNLVLYDEHKAQNSLGTIVPELAESWWWNEHGTRLTFQLREGVKWHDGQPFTSADVKCTWDLLIGRGAERLRLNPRKSWWNNVAEIATNGSREATFVLKRPQPAILALIASGYTPVYPCHVSAHEMPLNPIGTGPFKFVEFKPNEGIKLVRNPDYWKPGRPYLSTASNLSPAVGDLHAAAGQRPDHHGQQPIQRLAHGRRLARPLARCSGDRSSRR
jgi:peptide/nickel transport system substrate-binding protein